MMFRNRLFVFRYFQIVTLQFPLSRRGGFFSGGGSISSKFRMFVLLILHLREIRPLQTAAPRFEKDRKETPREQLLKFTFANVCFFEWLGVQIFMQVSLNHLLINCWVFISDFDFATFLTVYLLLIFEFIVRSTRHVVKVAEGLSVYQNKWNVEVGRNIKSPKASCRSFHRRQSISENYL